MKTAFTAVLLSCGALAAAEPERPNVLFILADDLGWGDLGCQGHPTMRTPNLDRLAAEGMRLTQASVASPICSPSRTAFLTGSYPARHRVHWVFTNAAGNAVRNMPERLDPAVPTLAGTLKAAGYATGHIGKWHLGSVGGNPSPLTQHGFDHCDPIDGDFGNHAAGQRDPAPAGKPGKDAHGLEVVQSSARIADRAIGFLTANAARPFYLQLWTKVPHNPMTCTPEQLAPFKNLVVDPQAPAFAPWMSRYYQANQGVLQSRMRTLHAAMADLDTQLGRVFATLDQLNLSQRTIIVLSSDNGPSHSDSSGGGVSSAGHLRGRKHTIYEGGVRVPFIVRWPSRVPTGRVDDTSAVNAVDLLPSVAALCGVTPPTGLDGVDRSPVWLGTPSLRAAPLHWEFLYRCGDPKEQSPPLAVRDGDWKLLTDMAGKRTELYDLAKDPSEVTDVAAANAEVVTRLRTLALNWQRTLPANPTRAKWTKPLDWSGR